MLFNLKSAPDVMHWDFITVLSGVLSWWMDMQVASLFVSNSGLNLEGGRGAEDNMWSLTCSLALYPYRFYITPTRGVKRESPHDHETHLQPQQLHQLPPPPSSSLLIHLFRLMPRLPLKCPCGRALTCWWRFGCENSGAPVGHEHWVWGTTRKGTWSVGVGTSCKRDVLTATTLS